MRRDVPEPWATWLVDAGLTSPRARQPIPSARQLADRVGVHTTTLMNMMYGATDTEPETVAAVAEALGVDVVRVSRQVGQARSQQAPWVPPFEANLLSRRQQRALSELIRAMAQEVDHGNAATIRRAEVSSATGVQVPQGPGVDVARRSDLDLAAMSGTPAHMPDVTTGEGSQVGPHDGDESA